MWIALIIALIIGAILLLPVHIVVKNDEGEFKFLIKVLFFTFGGKKAAKQKKKDNIVTHAIKKALGIDTVKKAQKEQSKQKQGLDFALGDIFRIVGNLLKELKSILKHCTVKKLWLKIRCTGDDAADAAIKYGRVCAVVYPFAALAHSVFKVKEKGKKLDIACDYEGDEDSYLFSIDIFVRLGRVLAAATKIFFKEIAERVKNESQK